MDSIDNEQFTWKGSNKINDRKRKAIDRDGVSMNLSEGSYGMILSESEDEMPLFKLEVMIRKGVDLKYQSFDLLQNFHHQNALLLLDYYNQGNQGRLVIPKVHTTFTIWLENKGKSLLFDATGHMTDLFKSMIIDFCDLIDNMHKQMLVIEKYDPDNLYINLFHPLPKLCVLLTSDHGEIKRKLGSDYNYLDWPYGNMRRIFDNLPSIIRDILDWEEKMNKRKYNTLDSLSYIIFLRNCYKHVLKFPERIKDILFNRNAVIKMIEEWTPDFWIKIYERIGWP